MFKTVKLWMGRRLVNNKGYERLVEMPPLAADQFERVSSASNGQLGTSKKTFFVNKLKVQSQVMKQKKSAKSQNDEFVISAASYFKRDLDNTMISPSITREESIALQLAYFRKLRRQWSLTLVSDQLIDFE